MRETKRMKQEIVFSGKRVEVKKVYYDSIHPMEHVNVCPAVAVLPITKEGNVVIIRQLRTAVNDKYLYEIPAGLIDEKDYLKLGKLPKEERCKEAARKAGIRELQEETGYIAKDIDFLGSVYTTPGFSNEEIFLFLASELSQKTFQNLDESEDIEVLEMSFEKVMEMVYTNQIKNVTTVAALLWYNEVK